MPLHLYAGLSGHRLTTILKAKRFTGAQRRAVLQRLVKRLRHAWPETRLIVRGDRHFASPEGMQWLDGHPELSYVTGLTSNTVLPAVARAVGEQAKRASVCSGHTGTRVHSTRSQAGTWWRARRVVLKVEGSDQGVNPRCVVTALEQARTQGLSQHLSCARGQAENESKEHQRYLKSERTACHRFEANQGRVFLHAAASVLLETVRRKVLRTTQWASATMETIQ
jgi:hypothetical protein